MTAPESERLLTAADSMLRGTGPLGVAAVEGGWWSKACACVIRLALESAIECFWEATNPAVARCANGRTKLLLLRQRVPADLARRTNYTWAALSRATHHHHFEATASAPELRALLHDASLIVAELRTAVATKRPINAQSASEL